MRNPFAQVWNLEELGQKPAWIEQNQQSCLSIFCTFQYIINCGHFCRAIIYPLLSTCPLGQFQVSLTNCSITVNFCHQVTNYNVCCTQEIHKQHWNTENKKLSYNKSDHWSIQLSIGHTDLQWLSRVSSRCPSQPYLLLQAKQLLYHWHMSLFSYLLIWNKVLTLPISIRAGRLNEVGWSPDNMGIFQGLDVIILYTLCILGYIYKGLMLH